MFTPTPSADTLHIAVGIPAYRGRHVAKAVKKSETKLEIQRAQREWLREVLVTTRLKPSQLAVGAGVSDTTLTRLLNNADYTGTLAPETVKRIKDTYKVPGPEEYTGGRRGALLLGLSEAARFDGKGERPELASIVELIVAGRPHVDAWRLKTMALENAGYLPGDVVFVERLAEGQFPKPQDAVCAQVVDWMHGSAETVWRIYDPPYLVGAANDRTAFKPILIDNERVKIFGMITESFRPHRLSANR